MCITSADGFRSYELLLPAEQFRPVDASGSRQPRAEPAALPVFRDALAESSLLRLSTADGLRQLSEDIGDEIAARQFVMRLCELIGIRPPGWHSTSSVFVPVVMRQLVRGIDGSLASPLSLESIAATVGLSPGHFARKFQHSVGMSLGRFTNSRRIGMSFGMLREGSLSLSRIALDLGFSSQSHFTRLFSGHTGIAPQQFRRQHLRMGV